MVKVSESGFEVPGRTTVICDYSPPRSGVPAQLQPPPPNADFLLVNSNPGRSVRADSAMLAAALKRQTGQEVIFALLTRDMNRLALQSHLLGAQMLGLENVVAAQGDPFQEGAQAPVKAVHDYRPTELLAAIGELNRGRDFRGRPLDAPTDFCAGATVDLGRPTGREVDLAARKVRAGAEFLITQPSYRPGDAVAFQEALAEAIGDLAMPPVYWGLQMLELGGVSFGSVPANVQRELAGGRSGVAIALELLEQFRQSSLRNIYLLPPIRRGGERDYGAAREFLAAARAAEEH